MLNFFDACEHRMTDEKICFPYDNLLYAIRPRSKLVEWLRVAQVLTQHSLPFHVYMLWGSLKFKTFATPLAIAGEHSHKELESDDW